MIRPIHVLPLLALLAATACSGPGVVRDVFNRNGEVIALSGGSAGAANACVTCHGLKGEGDGNRSPRIAGLDRGYIARQLGFYADGQRINARMVAVAKALTGEERQLVAAYYAALPAMRACPAPTGPAPAGRASVLSRLGDPSRGIAACAACHGAAGEGNAGNPPLAGQPAPYLDRQMQEWRDGNRYGDPLGVMTRIGKALTPAESAALTAYAARLPGDARYSALPEGCPPARRASPRSGA
jgi:cytochrome c553